MPPKKSQATKAVKKKQAKGEEEQKQQHEEVEEQEQEEHTELAEQQDQSSVEGEGEEPSTGDKRKEAPTDEEPEPKASKISSAFPKQQKIISFLLSDAALAFCQNAENASSSGKGYFSAGLAPFEHLLCAIILSKPLSHNLGQRTIATVLNEPYAWKNANDVLEAGKKSDEAYRKDSEGGTTAGEMGEMAQLVVDEGWDPEGDGSLNGLLEKVQSGEGEGDGDMQETLRKEVTKIKGVGGTAGDIFLRRVQGCKGWEGLGWFVDGKTKEALEGVGLPADGEKIKKLIEDLDSKNVRQDFVAVLERALGVSLDGKMDELKKEAEKN
ncbi:uncharacterized protein PAC_00248 [Phialocephala subalpina]|uniref:Uncharacterized protein n=1 Tax=Phialocephala subalpina TaxID=576137 RepID=A0A1L7WC57_9HELO|nr:uncharacterized protein PAC_00248 [Phialocephala subalpina]